MPSDYGYINARIRGLRSKLLGEEFFSEAVNASDLKAFISSLSQTSYMREVEEAQSRFDGIKLVDDAVARNFYQTARSMLNFSDGDAGALISTLLLRYDLNNLKSIARAKHAGREAEDIQTGLLPAGDLKPAMLETIAQAADMPAAAQATAVAPTPLRAAFVRAASQYASDNDLYALELALDRAYYKLVLERAKEHNAPKKFLRHIKREIDATNLRTALSLRGSNANIDGLFIKGGFEIDKATFDSIVAEGGSGLQALSGTSFGEVAEADNLSDAEVAIRNVLDRYGSSLASDSTNIGLAADYLRKKEAESAKLRLLARGKFYGVPKEALEKELGSA